MSDRPRYARLIVVLIRPSKYDDDGYVIRHLRGTLPSNTLSCLTSLTDDAVRSGALGELAVRVEVIDEIVSRVDVRRIVRTHRRSDTKIAVGLVGVQTNQFPRAQDLARQFKAEGCDVMIGGFHVSGAMAMAAATPPECRAMLEAGVTLVLGEVEDRWAGLLQDAVADRLQPLYNCHGQSTRFVRHAAAPRLVRDAEEIRAHAERDDRRRPGLSVQLLVLHDRQRAGARHAGA